MTVVAFIFNQHGGALFGDALLSSKQSPKGLVYLPGLPGGIQTKFETGWSPAALGQKIVQITDQVFVGWSGDYGQAQRLISFLEVETRSPFLTFSELGAIIDAFPLEKTDDLQAIVTYSAEPDAFSEFGEIHVIGVNVSEDCIAQAGPVSMVAIGRGAPHFLARAREFAFHNPTADGPAAAALIFAFNAMFTENDGGGLPETWGGYFEIAATMGGKMQKLDRVVAVMFGKKIGEQSYQVSSPWFYHTYFDKTLIVLAGHDDGTRTYVVPPTGLQPTLKGMISGLPRIGIYALGDFENPNGMHFVVEFYDEEDLRRPVVVAGVSEYRDIKAVIDMKQVRRVFPDIDFIDPNREE